MLNKLLNKLLTIRYVKIRPNLEWLTSLTKVKYQVSLKDVQMTVKLSLKFEMRPRTRPQNKECEQHWTLNKRNHRLPKYLSQLHPTVQYTLPVVLIGHQFYPKPSSRRSKIITGEISVLFYLFIAI